MWSYANINVNQSSFLISKRRICSCLLQMIRQSGKVCFWAQVFMLIILLGSGGCKNISYVPIDILRPAQTELPSSARHFAVGIRKSAADPKHNNEQLNTYVEENYMDGVLDMLDKTPRVDSVCHYGSEMGKKKRKPFQQLHWDTVEKICNATQTEALVSLEYYAYSDTIVFGYNRQNYRYNVVLETKDMALWRVYQPEPKQIVDEYLLKDTLTWTEEAITTRYALEELPSLLNARGESSYRAGVRYGKRIVPVWRKKQRKMFSKWTTREMRKAKKLAEKNNWLAAATLWKRLYYNTDKNNEIRWKSAYNMALASELKDELQGALDWINKASEISDNSDIKDYKKRLKKRIKNKKVLRKQLP